MPVAISYKETARAQFLGLDRKVQREVADAFSQIARDPLHPAYWLDVEPNRGMTRGWRLSVEGYRATYRVERTNLVVLDLQPGHQVDPEMGFADGELAGVTGERILVVRPSREATSPRTSEMRWSQCGHTSPWARLFGQCIHNPRAQE